MSAAEPHPATTPAAAKLTLSAYAKVCRAAAPPLCPPIFQATKGQTKKEVIPAVYLRIFAERQCVPETKA